MNTDLINKTDEQKNIKITNYLRLTDEIIESW